MIAWIWSCTYLIRTFPLQHPGVLVLLTDAFFRRYEGQELFASYGEPQRRFLDQAAQIITKDLLPRNKLSFKEASTDPAFQVLEAAYEKLARELGVTALVSPGFNHSWKAPNGNTVNQWVSYTIDNKSTLYLTMAFNESQSPDLFMKHRISLIELCFQEQMRRLEVRKVLVSHSLGQDNTAINLYDALQTTGQTWHSKEKSTIEIQEDVFNKAVIELNERFRQARIPLGYHNGLIQVSDDALVEEQVERPFWSIVAQPKWQSVDQLIKEAIDKRDRSERDCVTPAMQALESVIKIISTDKGWNTGKESGAAYYINNLVKERDGQRFIEVWEKDALDHLFGKIRNSFGHGPGSNPLPTLLPQQTHWAIDTVMAWIKSLVRRM